MQSTPNIILINCDDLGWGDLSCCGHPRNRTPYLDTMASEGIRFTDFYMASPVCSPSRGAMMTGCYPQRIGFGSFDGQVVLFPGDPIGLNPKETTIPQLLKNAGYATKIVGKWHCGDQPEFLPTRYGFDEYYGLPYSNDMGRQSRSDKQAGLGKQYPPLPLMRNEEVIEAQPDQAGITERYVEESLRFIRDHREGPFFLYLAHMYVHLPIYVQDRFMRESKNGSYGAAVAAIDWAAGVLMHELKDLGIDDNTLIIFTSDNGSRNDFGDSNGALRGVKGTTWEGGMRVPCIARWPGRIKAGQVSHELVTSMDLLPTFAELCGIDLPSDRTTDGNSILSILLNRGGSGHEIFFYYRMDTLEAVRKNNWKLHVYKDGKKIRELYDLFTDIGECQNRAADHPEIIAELESECKKCRSELGDDAYEITGSGCRPHARVKEPKTLTHFDPDHPYYIAMYDLSDAG